MTASFYLKGLTTSLIEERTYNRSYPIFQPISYERFMGNLNGSDLLSDTVPIKFKLKRAFEICVINHATNAPLEKFVFPFMTSQKILKHEILEVSLSSFRQPSMRREHTETLTEIVSRIYDNLNEDRRREIVLDILEVLDREETVPLEPILCELSIVTLSLYADGPLSVPLNKIYLPFFLPIIDDLDKVVFPEAGAGADDHKYLSCPICFEEFEAGVGLTRLPCSHLFHEQCICPWLNKHRYHSQGRRMWQTKDSPTCPMCRLPRPNLQNNK